MRIDYSKKVTQSCSIFLDSDIGSLNGVESKSGECSWIRGHMPGHSVMNLMYGHDMLFNLRRKPAG